MTWTQTDLDNLIIIADDALLKLTEVLVNKLDLGQKTHLEEDMLQLLINVMSGLEYGAPIYEDSHYDYAQELISRIHAKCLKYKGL